MTWVGHRTGAEGERGTQYSQAYLLLFEGQVGLQGCLVSSELHALLTQLICLHSRPHQARQLSQTDKAVPWFPPAQSLSCHTYSWRFWWVSARETQKTKSCKSRESCLWSRSHIKAVSSLSQQNTQVLNKSKCIKSNFLSGTVTGNELSGQVSLLQLSDS